MNIRIAEREDISRGLALYHRSIGMAFRESTWPNESVTALVTINMREICLFRTYIGHKGL